MEIQVALVQIRSDNSLKMCRKVYGMADNMASIIVREFYVTLKVHLKPLVIQKWTATNYINCCRS